ncbi:MAG TPA: ergothioneine biosynthesis protein EgtB [Flavobacteriales bacterium]|jgi:ergothioneine biosynthesis protein EgtB|nr:ergothioneine biosynthesis protein EgtB [Flavobacteriales bacterium]
MEQSVLAHPDISTRYAQTRKRTERICAPLEIEDYVVQPIIDVSPPKWHLAHTTWFFEQFVLKAHVSGYAVFDLDFGFLFNSYYLNLGEKVARNRRGELSRPTVKRIYEYRAHVDEAMISFLESGDYADDLISVIELGLNHEEQHQELLWTDLKYILGNNPIYPVYSSEMPWNEIQEQKEMRFRRFNKGVYRIGFQENGFCLDNELNPHDVHVESFQISDRLVTNKEYIEFIEYGGYQDFNLWHEEGWWWRFNNKINHPMYWHKVEGQWKIFTLSGLTDLKDNELVKHVSLYEAAAFATWKGMRLPTEFEWEIAARDGMKYGQRWEWTGSAYGPYPGYTKAEGAIGEYNGKFMINQMVLRGSSVATSPGHSRVSYRNFFHPHLQWQFTGIRLAK